jgi:hypothetical protein
MKKSQYVNTWVTGTKIMFNLDPQTQNQCGGGLEQLHHSPVSRKRRQKGNPVPGVQLGHPVPGGSLRRDSKVWLRVLRDSDPRVTDLYK